MTVQVKASADNTYGALQVNGVDKLYFGKTGDNLEAVTNSTLSGYSQRTLTAAVATTSGTAIDFTGIPSWVKKITIQFLDVSTSGTSNPIVRLGSGSITETGYISSVTVPSQAAATGGAQFTTGFGFSGQSAANLAIGHMTITQQSGNTWIESTVGCFNGFSITWNGGGKVTLSGALDRIRITTVNGTDTFDAGSVSLLIEG